MATILRTETNVIPQGQTFEKLIMADSGKRFNFIKIAGVPQTFTNNKEFVANIPAGNEDVEIIVCQETDVAPPPSKFKVRVQFNSANAQIQMGFGGAIYDGYGIYSGYPQYPPAGIEYTSGQTFDGWVSIKPSVLSQNELLYIRVNGVAQSGVVGVGTALVGFIVTQDTLIEIGTQPKGSIATYSVTATAGAGGTVTPANQTVSAGNPAFINITVSAGKQVKSVTVKSQPLTAFNRNGGSLNLGAIYANTSAHVIFEDISSATAPATNAVINWFVYDRYIGSATQALQNDRSTFINANITARVTKKNDVVLPSFALPYAYTGDKLTLETTWDIGRTTIDEFLDSLNSNYLRLAINSVTKDGGNLYITTRLNNSYANANAGFTPAQVAFCRMKVTDPNGQVLFYNHPVLSSITDLMHTVPLTVVGVYQIETETILVGSNLRTSYSKSFAELIIQ